MQCRKLSLYIEIYTTFFLSRSHVFHVVFDISDERRPVNHIRLAKSKQSVPECNSFPTAVSHCQGNGFSDAKRERITRTKIKFPHSLMCEIDYDNCSNNAGLLQGIKNPLRRRADKVLKNITELIGKLTRVEL